MFGGIDLLLGHRHGDRWGVEGAETAGNFLNCDCYLRHFAFLELLILGRVEVFDVVLWGVLVMPC